MQERRRPHGMDRELVDPNIPGRNSLEQKKKNIILKPCSDTIGL